MNCLINYLKNINQTDVKLTQVYPSGLSDPSCMTRPYSDPSLPLQVSRLGKKKKKSIKP